MQRESALSDSAPRKNRGTFAKNDICGERAVFLYWGGDLSHRRGREGDSRFVTGKGRDPMSLKKKSDERAILILF